MVKVTLGVDGLVRPVGEVLSQQSIGVFVAAALPRAFGITEVDADICRDSELSVVGQFGSPVSGQRRHDSLRQMLHPGNQRADGAVAVLSSNLDQHHKAQAAFDQRCDVAVLGAAQQVTFLSAGRRCLHRCKASDRGWRDPQSQLVCRGSIRHR